MRAGSKRHHREQRTQIAFARAAKPGEPDI
jgi:hypothetical protein